MIALGPFDLLEPIGRGGMGVVWRGVHRDWRAPVAIKLLTAERAQDPEYLEQFRNEVRAVAALDHPHIVLVYDHGTVPAVAAASSEGLLAPGTPWLAMELAEGGSLSRRAPTGWRELRQILLALLDALAHAHARGVLHRDIKPGNVLLGGERPGIKLTDFGMAAAIESSEQPLFLGGTPTYMPPEQIECRLRELGPWTDLYALGCLAWTLCTGSPPFAREGALLAHLEAELPRLQPWFEVPGELEAWLRALLEKDPGRRVQRAADAAWTLLQLPDAMPGDPPPGLRGGEDETVPARTTLIWPSGSGPRSRPTDRRPGRSAPQGAAPRRPIPPLPLTWRRPPAPIAPARLRGVGLGLWGLRTIPLVDRETERDAMWAALRATRAEGRPRAIVLRGPAGFGRSRLAAWIGERAHEVGSATVLEASFVADPALDPIPEMIARYLRVQGASREDVHDRVRAVLGTGDDDALALTELLAPADEASDVRSIKLRSRTERFAVIARLLVRVAAERPVLLLFDDVHRGEDGVALARFLLEVDAPILLVLTVRDEALADRPEQARALEALSARPGVTSIPVGPLPVEHRRVLVRELLGLEGDVAAEVETRTDGNPLFAVQLVGDWVARGLLVPGDQGFRLVGGAALELPQSLHAIWSDRVLRILQGRPPSERIALELAAVLGLEVDGTEWRAVCALSGVRASPELVERLLASRLATCGPQGPRARWALSHGMLRESIVRLARDAGRLQAHRVTCAAMLRARADQGAVVERLGRMLLDAGQLAEAVDPLLEAARRRNRDGDSGIAAALLADREAAMESLGVPETDPRRVDGWVLGCQVQQNSGDIALAQHLAERAVRVAERIGHTALLVPATRQLGRILRRRGDVERAWALLQECERHAMGLGDHEALGGCRSDMAWILLRRGKIEAAAELAALALQDYRRSQPGGVAAVHMQLGEIARQAGAYEEAESHLSSARRRFEEQGLRWGVASATNALGELARSLGDLERAERLYRESYERYSALGETDAAFPEANLGLVLVESGQLTEGRRVLERCLARATQADLWRLVGGVLGGLVACTAAQGDWNAFDGYATELAALIAEHKLVEADTARYLDQAATTAERAGKRGRARTCYGLAREQWRALGRVEDADRAEAARKALA